MSRFDHKDFAANPGKYALFSTAKIAAHIFTNNGENDIAADTVVGIDYQGIGFNRMYQRNEPIYRLIGLGCDVYAHNLKDFVL